MSTVKIWYDEKGRIKEIKRPPIFATSKKVDRIEAYTDFDSKDYDVSISFKRSDGVMLGAYPMNPMPLDDGKVYHSYMLDKLETRVAGPLQLTIRYEKYGVDPITGDSVLISSKPVAMTEIYIYETVDDARDKLSQLLLKMKKIEEEIKELESGLLDMGIRVHPPSREEPDDMKNGDLWFQIID